MSDTLRRLCDSKAIPGIAVAIARSGETTFNGAFGTRSLATNVPMTADSVFWLASMTKAITTAAALQLVEQGALSLDKPIGDTVPELANMQVLDGFDSGGKPRLRAARTQPTLRQLLTHTSGFGYDMWNGDLLTYMKNTGVPGTASCKRAALTAPLAFDPGTRWQYGIGIDVLGLLIEAASGTTLDTYINDKICAPLGMVDTSFKLTPSQRERLVGMHTRGADSALKAIPFETVQDPEINMGGGGLYGTAADYICFARMILNRGKGNGHTILKPETVGLMSSNQMGELLMTPMPTAIPGLTNNVDLMPDIDKKWSLGFMLNTRQTAEGRSAGSMAWAGLANTYYWIDPVQDITGVILMQVLPFADPTCMSAFAEFERAAYGALASKAA